MFVHSLFIVTEQSILLMHGNVFWFGLMLNVQVNSFCHFLLIYNSNPKG